MKLEFEAGRIAQVRGWQSPRVISAELVDQQPPGGGQVIVLAQPGSMDVARARIVAALIASGTDLLVVASESLPAEVARWLPDRDVHLLGAAVEDAGAAEETAQPAGGAAQHSIEVTPAHLVPPGLLRGVQVSHPSAIDESLRRKAKILADLWSAAHGQESWASFFKWADLGVPAAMLMTNGYAKLTTEGEMLISETYSMLVKVLDIPDAEYAHLEAMFDAQSGG